jgi:NAD(P)H-flavin reductase
MEVLSQGRLAHKIFAMRLRGEIVSSMRPGQFINIRVPRADLGLRRPISISEIFPEEQECTIVYRVEGEGTAQMSLLQASDTLDVLGPLGRGFPVGANLSEPVSPAQSEPSAHLGAPSATDTTLAGDALPLEKSFEAKGLRWAVDSQEPRLRESWPPGKASSFAWKDFSRGSAFIIGGGIGVPPLLEVAKQLHASGAKVYAFLGFATEDAIFYEEEFSRYAEVMVSTDDGSYGFKGNAMQTMQTVLESGVQPSAVYSCGPTPLLRAVDAKFAGHDAAYVSLEARMACGIGACYACVCHVLGDETNTLAKKVCDQGPVFKCGEVVI